MYGSAHTQQAPLKLHEETWEGVCVVKVACPFCPDYSPEPPGPDRVIGNMIGWSLQEKTEWSGRESFFSP